MRWGIVSLLLSLGLAMTLLLRGLIRV